MLTHHPAPQHLSPTPQINSDHSIIVSFAHNHAQGSSDLEKAVSLYLAVRDQVRYDPYRIDLSDQGMTASTVPLRSMR